MLLVSQIESVNMRRLVASLWGLPPLHASGVEETLLNVLNSEQCNHLIDRLTNNIFAYEMHRSKSPPTKEIEWMTEQGRSYDCEEHVEGTQCVASAVFFELGAPKCVLSIGGPRVRISEGLLVGHDDTAARTANWAIQRFGGVSPSHWAKYD